MRVRLVDDPRAKVGEDVGVGVGPVEFQLKPTQVNGLPGVVTEEDASAVTAISDTLKS